MVKKKLTGCLFYRSVVFLSVCCTIGGKVIADYREFIAQSGSTVPLDCYGTHSTYDSITWWKNNSVDFVAQKGLGFKHFSSDYSNRLRFFENTKKLMIFDCQGKDHGFYYCETIHGSEKRRGGYYNFIVEEKPRCKRIASDLNVLDGASVDLPCLVQGTPKPNYEWYKLVNKTKVKLGSRFSVSEKGLHIKKVNIGDNGVYGVKLENRIDRFYHTIQLSVKTLKSISKENHKSAHLSSVVSFSCGSAPLKEDTSVNWVTSTGHDAALINRFKVVNNGSLFINKIQLMDSGLYTCKKRTKIDGGIFTESVLVYLNVQYAPLITVIRKEVKVNENSQALIPCSAKGNPKASYRWLSSNGDLIISSKKHELLSNGSIIVRNVQRTDAMNYTCIPYNAVGDGKLGQTKLSVIVPPYFQRNHDEEIRARVGDNVRINCSASGIPKPTVTWKYISKPNNKINPTHDNRKIISESGLFSINIVGRSDEGTYICIAQSSAGKSERQIKLVVLNKPKVPVDFFVRTQNESMFFSWKPGYDGGANQTFELWYRSTDKTDYQWSSVNVKSTAFKIHLDDTNIDGNKDVSFYCSLRSKNTEGYSDFTYVIKTSKLLPGAKKLPGTILGSPLSNTPLAPHDCSILIYEDKYELKWKYNLTPGRPASKRFLIEYRENNSTSVWKTYIQKDRYRRSTNPPKKERNIVNISVEDIPRVKHPLKFRVFSISALGIKSKAVIPIVTDLSITAVTGKTAAGKDTNLIPPIVMGVIFGLFTVLIIIGLYCYCERKKKRLTSKDSKASLVPNDNNNIAIDRNSMELHDKSKLLTSEIKDMPRYHFSTCPALKLGESSHPTDTSQPDDVYVLLEPNSGENAACTCSKKYVTEGNFKTENKKRSLYKSSSLPSVLFASDADVSSVDPSVDGRDFGVDRKKDGSNTLDKDAISRLQRGGLFRDSYDKFCRSGSSSKNASRVPSTTLPVVEKRNLNKLPETDTSSTATPVVENANILRRNVDDDESPETKSNKSIDGKSSGFGDGDSSTSDPDSIELDRFETPVQLTEATSQLLSAISKKDTGYFSDVPTRISPLFIDNHKFHPIQKHRLGTKGAHSGYFSEDETVTRSPYRPSQPPPYNQAIVDIERMTDCNGISDSENMYKKLFEMEKKMGVKLDDSIENNLDKILIKQPISRFQNSYLDSGYMSDVSSTLKTRYTNKEKNERCAQLLNEFKIYRKPVSPVDFTEGILEEDLPPPGSTPKHVARSISAMEDFTSEEPVSPSLKRSNSTNSNLFTEWLV